jgi:hypothetical protein
MFGAASENGADCGFLHPSRKKVRESHSKQKGEDMKRNYFRMFVVSFGAAVLAAASHAADLDRLVVDIPYDFVVNGKTLPAGKYNVSRSTNNNPRILSISGVDNHASAVALSTDMDQPRDSRPRITLRRTGDQTVLTKIQTAEHVFTFPVSRQSSQSTAPARDAYLTGTSESQH